MYVQAGAYSRVHKSRRVVLTTSHSLISSYAIYAPTALHQNSPAVTMKKSPSRFEQVIRFAINILYVYLGFLEICRDGHVLKSSVLETLLGAANLPLEHHHLLKGRWL